MMTEVIVYGHGCLSQERLLERLETFRRRVSGFEWRMANPEEQRQFMRRHTVIVFPVVQIGQAVIQGIPEIEELQSVWQKTR
jgi:hypothetical protein